MNRWPTGLKNNDVKLPAIPPECEQALSHVLHASSFG